MINGESCSLLCRGTSKIFVIKRKYEDAKRNGDRQTKKDQHWCPASHMEITKVTLLLFSAGQVMSQVNIQEL